MYSIRPNRVGLAPSIGQGQADDPALDLYYAANALHNRGLHEPAAKEYEAFLRAHPGHPKAPAARLALAGSLAALGRDAEAEEAYRTALARAHDDAAREAAEAGLLDLLARRGRWDEAHFDRSKQALVDALRNEGYACAAVTGNVQIDPAEKKAFVTFTVSPGPLSRFGDVTMHVSSEGEHDIPERTDVRKCIITEETIRNGRLPLLLTKSDVDKGVDETNYEEWLATRGETA